MHNELVGHLNSTVSGCNATAVTPEIGDSSIFVEPSHIKAVCEELKAGEWLFHTLQVITGTDYEDRIEVSYILCSYTKNNELILKVKLPKPSSDSIPEIDSVCSVWKAANWQERECWDMVGVKFNGHPDHRRILCPDDWEGFPLRKDYVVQEEYHGMKVNPEDKINNADHHFFKKIQETLEDPKKISHSWKGE